MLTLYAFSTENWKRPKDEVSFLMQLPVDFFDTFVPELIKENVKVHVMGYENVLPEHTQDAVRRAIEQTKNNTGMVLNFALNYGSRAEIVTAVQEIAEEVAKGEIHAEEIDDELIAKHLMTGFLPKELQDPELMIRTSGEERISNFLLWQIAYSELYFTKALWPDFDGAHLEEAIASYQNRDRRFGGVKKQKMRRGSVMKQRVITAAVALVLFIPIIWIGGIAVELTAAILAVVGVYELFRMKGLTLLSFEGVLSAVGAVLLVLPKERWFFFLPENVSTFMLFYLIVMILLGTSVISKNTYTIDEAGFPVLVSLYVGIGFQNFVNARTESLAVLIFGLFIVWATDIGAYMVGRRYGQHKLSPDISPNKTIEGALGGIGSAVVVAFLYLLLYPAKELFNHGMFVMLLMTIIFSAVGQFGDLVESAIKRHYDVKDSGNILPGHGGILDRFDSLLFVFPIMHLFGII